MIISYYYKFYYYIDAFGVPPARRDQGQPAAHFCRKHSFHYYLFVAWPAYFKRYQFPANSYAYFYDGYDVTDIAVYRVYVSN